MKIPKYDVDKNENIEKGKKPGERDKRLRKKGLGRMRRNRAGKGAGKQEKQPALKAKQLIRGKQSARQQSRGGNSSWEFR